MDCYVYYFGLKGPCSNDVSALCFDGFPVSLWMFNGWQVRRQCVKSVILGNVSYLVSVYIAIKPSTCALAGNEDHLYVVPATNLLQWSVEPSILLTMGGRQCRCSP